MRIVFKGEHTSEEAAESLLSILKLFRQNYGISNFREMDLEVTLLNSEGEDVELIDAVTSDVLGVFEVHQSTSEEYELDRIADTPCLRLVVDNTQNKL